MVPLLAGTFVMGDNAGDSTEKPTRRVRLRGDFAIGKYEVTVGQWNTCVAAGGCQHRSKKAGDTDDLAMRDVSWNDAMEYVRWLSSISGATYRLPSEAEWEFAARGGSSTRYWWGDSPGHGNANCRDCGGQWDRKFPAPVGSFPANPFGLHDMNGSVWEWVADCWHNSYAGAPSDGSVWDQQNCRVRVLRGGSWRNDPTYVRSASRFKYDADVRYTANGFRVAKTLD
jgi:formylglycine-generating enzyme required for sulfatase activity